MHTLFTFPSIHTYIYNNAIVLICINLKLLTEARRYKEVASRLKQKWFYNEYWKTYSRIYKLCTWLSDQFVFLHKIIFCWLFVILEWCVFYYIVYGLWWYDWFICRWELNCKICNRGVNVLYTNTVYIYNWETMFQKNTKSTIIRPTLFIKHKQHATAPQTNNMCMYSYIIKISKNNVSFKKIKIDIESKSDNEKR